MGERWGWGTERRKVTVCVRQGMCWETSWGGGGKNEQTSGQRSYPGIWSGQLQNSEGFLSFCSLSLNCSAPQSTSLILLLQTAQHYRAITQHHLPCCPLVFLMIPSCISVSIFRGLSQGHVNFFLTYKSKQTKNPNQQCVTSLVLFFSVGITGKMMTMQ